MKRRTIVKRLSATALTTTALAGTASATSGASLELDREIDVADVSGTVALADLLTEEDLADLDVDPERIHFRIDQETTAIEPGIQTCCNPTSGCCSDCPPYCRCCDCRNCDEDDVIEN